MAFLKLPCCTEISTGLQAVTVQPVTLTCFFFFFVDDEMFLVRFELLAFQLHIIFIFE